MPADRPSTGNSLRSLLTALLLLMLRYRYRETMPDIPVENLIGRADCRFASFDPGARIWQVWKMPAAIRFSRFFGVIR